MTPQSRFTIFHSSLPVEGLVVKDPIGWDTAVITLERSKNFHSLVEYFKGNFMWYGEAMETLKTIEKNFGINAYVRLEIDLSYKTGVWVNIYEGQVKLAMLEEIMIADKAQYKMTVPIVRDDFWTKFINRQDSQVDLQATVDLDGNARTAVNKIVLPMPSQKIRSTYRKETNHDYDGVFPLSANHTDSFNDGTSSRDYFIGMETMIDAVSEIEQKVPYGALVDRTLDPVENLFYIFKLKYGGTYKLSAHIHYMLRQSGVSGTIVTADWDVKWYYQLKVNGELQSAVQIGSTDTFATVRLDNTSVTPLLRYGETELSEVTLDLNAGDEIYIWGTWEFKSIAFSSSGTLTQSVRISTDYADDKQSALQLLGDTTYPQTDTDAYLIKDAAESIVSKLVGQNSAVKSDYLATCKGRNAIFRGKHVRGYRFSGDPDPLKNKAISMSFDDWWKGADPLLFLGLGYTEVAGVKKIEIENRAYFYDKVPVVNISNVNELVRRYDLEKIYKSIEIGYKKGVGSESESGIDDTQTKRFFNTDLEGSKETILCEWMAASLAIEKSRRNRIEITKDFANDEEIMVVAVTPDGSDWLPEFGTAFNLVTNLLNPDFRINIRHSATRLFKRAQAWFNGCMLYSDTGVFTFNRGEGNYEMTSQLEDTDCEAVPGTEPIIDEGADIAADTSDILFVPRVYETEVPMLFATYQQIVANKNNAIGVSRTNAGHVPMFIMELGFSVFESKATLTLLQATENNL